MQQYTFLLVILFSCFGLACQEKATSETNNATNEALVRTYFQHFNQHDWEKMASLYADTAEMKDPDFGNKIVKQTHKEIVQKYTALQQAIPDAKDSIVAIYRASPQTIVEFIASGTAPDKTKFQLPICVVFTIKNGKITQDFTYYDASCEGK